MSENVVVALIGVIGSVMGALIGGLIQREGPINSRWLASVLTVGGLLLGLLIGLLVVNGQRPDPPTPEPGKESARIDPSPASVFDPPSLPPTATTPPPTTAPIEEPTPTDEPPPTDEPTRQPPPTDEPPIPTPTRTTAFVVTPPSIAASLESVLIDHDVTEAQNRGMRARVTFTVDNMKDVPGEVRALISYSNGQPLQGFTATSTIDGALGFRTPFQPAYDPQTRYDQLAVFLPYNEFYLRPGTYDLVLTVQIVDTRNGAVLATAAPYSFQFTQQAPASSVTLDVSGDWVGTIEYTQNDGSKVSFLFSMTLAQSGGAVSGTSSIIAPTGETAKMNVQGSVSDTQFTFQETEVVQTNAPGGYGNSGRWCLKQGTLSYLQGSGSFAQIDGLSGAINTPGCFPGTISLLHARK